VAATGEILRIEGGAVVTREPETGGIVGSFPAELGTGLAIAPWGDVVYFEAAPGDTAAVHCADPSGRPQWSLPLDGPGPLAFPPLALGDVVVLVRGGRLEAVDRDGTTGWAVDAEVGSVPVRLDADRVLVELAGRGLYLLDGTAGALTPVAVPSPAFPPFAAVRRPGAGYLVAGVGPEREGPALRRGYPVVAVEPGGAPAWEHWLPARPRALLGPAGGGLVVAASPDPEWWRTYQGWADPATEAFVSQLEPDGTPRWTWPAPGPLSHLPAVSSSGAVYVGCGGQLRAFGS
jgi:outer membrane protein assembly factor BamB